MDEITYRWWRHHVRAGACSSQAHFYRAVVRIPPCRPYSKIKKIRSGKDWTLYLAVHNALITWSAATGHTMGRTFKEKHSTRLLQPPCVIIAMMTGWDKTARWGAHSTILPVKNFRLTRDIDIGCHLENETYVPHVSVVQFWLWPKIEWVKRAYQFLARQISKYRTALRKAQKMYQNWRTIEIFVLKLFNMFS